MPDLRIITPHQGGETFWKSLPSVPVCRNQHNPQPFLPSDDGLSDGVITDSSSGYAQGPLYLPFFSVPAFLFASTGTGRGHPVAMFSQTCKCICFGLVFGFGLGGHIWWCPGLLLALPAYMNHSWWVWWTIQDWTTCKVNALPTVPSLRPIVLLVPLPILLDFRCLRVRSQGSDWGYHRTHLFCLPTFRGYCTLLPNQYPMS